jgi:hypothetical protein
MLAPLRGVSAAARPERERNMKIRLPFVVALVVLAFGVGGTALGASGPSLVRDREAARFRLTPPNDPSSLDDVIQPDTQIEPSIAVNPVNSLNAVAGFQEGRRSNGGDMTNGFATTLDGGKTWTFGEIPGLTRLVGGGNFDRASDAVVAFGPDGTVFYNSLVFDLETNQGLRSGLAVNLSHDGGRTWSAPAVFQDDYLGGLNDKNWIVVDTGKGFGHHPGRVYAVWDRVAPVVYNYCDSLERDCSTTANWLPNFLTISPLQGIGAIPVVLQDGSLGVVYESITAVPAAAPGDEADIAPGFDQIQLALAPGAGSVPWPAPLTFTQTTIPVASNQSAGARYQRAAGLPISDVDPGSGAIFVAWEDSRFRTEPNSPVNDVVFTKSTDGGLTWGAVTRVNTGPTNDYVNRYNVALDVGEDNIVHIAYRQRQEAADARGPGMSAFIDTFYQESRNGGTSFSAPLRVDRQRTNFFYGAFSRAGLFEGDYNQIATGGGLTYVVRNEAYPLSSKEPPGLVYNAADDNYVGNTSECPKDQNGDPIVSSGCLRHLHQRTWVAVVRSG